MQKLIVLFIAIILSAGLTAQTTETKSVAPKPSGWAKLTDTTYTLRFPNDWTADQSGMFGSRFFLFAPLDSLDDTFRENFNLILNDMKEYPDLTLEFLADGAKSQIESMINDVKVVEFRIVHVGDDKYYLVEYTGKQGQFELHWKQRYWLANNKFYVLTFTAEERHFARYLPVADQVFSSFSFR